MAFQLIPVTSVLEVEGSADSIGDFRGRVVAIAMRDTDPVASTVLETDRPAEESDGTPETEGLSGWGSTYFLVADVEKPAPVWVAKADVDKHAVE